MHQEHKPNIIKTTKEMNLFNRDKQEKAEPKQTGTRVKLIKETFVTRAVIDRNIPADVKTHYRVEILYTYDDGKEYHHQTIAALNLANASEIYEDIVSKQGATDVVETIKEAYIEKKIS